MARKANRRASRRSSPRSSSGGGRKSPAPKRPRKVGARRQPARSSSARDAKRDQPLVRLNKFLADCGVASRRGCDELIEKGKVTVDGMPVTALGTRVDPAAQVVEVDGYVLRPEHTERRYYLLNKPSGVVCTNEKRETRPRAIDLVTDKAKGRIYTVGRLDEESTGLILLTNDGEFAQRVAHPRYGVPKTYRVKVQGRIPDTAVQKVRQGVHLSDGKTRGARILVKRRTAKTSTLEVTLMEGKNREVRRVFARVGYKVLILERTHIGPLSVRGLKAGRWRALSREEVEGLLEEMPQAPTAAREKKPRAGGQERKRPAGKRPAGKKPAGKSTGGKRPARKSPARKAPARRRKPETDDGPVRRRRIVGPK